MELLLGQIVKRLGRLYERECSEKPGLKIGFWTEERGCHSQETVQDGEEWQGSVLAMLLFPLYIKIVFPILGLKQIAVWVTAD